jgi:hypothetical protein
MRRSLRLILVFIVPLALLAGAYAGTWFYLAGMVRTSIQNWAEARRVEGFTVGWDRYAISGFPLALTLAIEKPVFGRASAAPGYEAHADRLVAMAWPWALRRWHATTGPAQLRVEPGPARPMLTLDVLGLELALAPRADEGPQRRPGNSLTILADNLTATSGARLAAGHVEAQADLPDGPVATHREIWTDGTFELDRLVLPTGVPPLGETVDRLAGRFAVKGTIPPGPRRSALAAWSEDGGTLELERIELEWGKLKTVGSGTLALDKDLQPEGALTATIRGHNEVIDALVGSGSLKEGDAALAKLALGLLAKPASDGGQQINAPVSIQSGQIFVGPIRLARMPNFTWE